MFSVRADESDRVWEARCRAVKRDVIGIAHFVHQHVCDTYAQEAIAEEPNARECLTRYEIEVLRWAADGRWTDEIAGMMRISVPAAKAHLDSARFKLQALNRNHAIVKALRAGLIR
jgi:DNA-binding CsgD family transcriptional regulator